MGCEARCWWLRTGAAPHETHQTVKVEAARQPAPFLSDIAQAAQQKIAGTECLLDHSEWTLTRMTTRRVYFLSLIGRHLLCMSLANVFVRFAAERPLFGFSRHAHGQQRTPLAVVCGCFEATAFDLRSACAPLDRLSKKRQRFPLRAVVAIVVLVVHKRLLGELSLLCAVAVHAPRRQAIVSFRQACMNAFSRLATVAGFLRREDQHGRAKTWRDSGTAGTRAGAV